MPEFESIETGEIEATVVFSEDRPTRPVKPSPETSPDGAKHYSYSEGPGFDRRFVFICDFAKGGIGNIAKAQDLEFDRVVAVKTLNDEHAAKPSSVESFERECRLNARLEHPSVVPIYARGSDSGGKPGVAMKLINGIALNKFIHDLRKQYDARKIKPQQEHHALVSRLEYFLKCCEVIEYCHSLNIVHGDLKPQNILMGRFGELYVVDWGCARSVGEKPERLTGTPNYMPPEYLKTKTVSPQVDIYALGMILFELVTLRHGCSGHSKSKENIKNSTTLCLITDSESYRHYMPNLKIPSRLKAIIMKATSPSAGLRYATVRALADDVRHYIYNEEISAAPDNLIQKTFRIMSHNRIKTAAAIGALVLILLGGWAYTGYRSAIELNAQSEDMVRRMRLQSYTNIISVAATKQLLAAQCQLMLLADNVIEDSQEKLSGERRFYDNADYASATTAPPGTALDPDYPRAVNYNEMVRLNHAEGMKDKLGAGQYITLCQKIVNYNLSDSGINLNASPDLAMSGPRNLIHRLQILWDDGSCYSYPGTYEEPSTEQYKTRFGNREADRGRKILWTEPYQGLTGMHRIGCRYPMYTKDGKYLGEARLELRLERLLESAIDANRRDPVHKLFFISANGSVVKIDDGKLHIMPQGSDESKSIMSLRNDLVDNHMQQFEAIYENRNYFVSGAMIQTVNGMLLQMIEVGAMKSHQHIDLSL